MVIATAIKTNVRQVMDHPARVAQSADPTIVKETFGNGTHAGTRSSQDRARPAAAHHWWGIVHVRRVGASSGCSPRLQMSSSIRKMGMGDFKEAVISMRHSNVVGVDAQRGPMKPERCKIGVHARRGIGTFRNHWR